MGSTLSHTLPKGWVYLWLKTQLYGVVMLSQK